MSNPGTGPLGHRTWTLAVGHGTGPWDIDRGHVIGHTLHRTCPWAMHHGPLGPAPGPVLKIRAGSPMSCGQNCCCSARILQQLCEVVAAVPEFSNSCLRLSQQCQMCFQHMCMHACMHASHRTSTTRPRAWGLLGCGLGHGPQTHEGVILSTKMPWNRGAVPRGPATQRARV